jgi:hypothetical protein
MNTVAAVAILFLLIFGPVFLQIVVHALVPLRFVRILTAMVIAAAAGAAAWWFATALGWQPVLKGGRVVDASPTALFWFFSGSLLVILLLFVRQADGVPLALARAKDGNGRDGEEEWRVGHTGRDCMYYEEYREGRWERIEISGEMLMGPAHHVIYFASREQWKAYPEWARGRRSEIIARIKSRFAPPDYEYYGA